MSEELSPLAFKEVSLEQLRALFREAQENVLSQIDRSSERLSGLLPEGEAPVVIVPPGVEAVRLEFRAAKEELVAVSGLSRALDMLEAGGLGSVSLLEFEYLWLGRLTFQGDYFGRVFSLEEQKDRFLKQLHLSALKKAANRQAFYKSLVPYQDEDLLRQILGAAQTSSLARLALGWIADGAGNENWGELIRFWQPTDATAAFATKSAAWVDLEGAGINMIIHDYYDDDFTELVAHEGRHWYQWAEWPVCPDSPDPEQDAVNKFVALRFVEADARAFGELAMLQSMMPQFDIGQRNLCKDFVQYLASPEMTDIYDPRVIDHYFLDVLTDGRLRGLVEASPWVQDKTLDKILRVDKDAPGLMLQTAPDIWRDFRSFVIDRLCVVQPPAEMMEAYFKAKPERRGPWAAMAARNAESLALD